MMRGFPHIFPSHETWIPLFVLRGSIQTGTSLAHRLTEHLHLSLSLHGVGDMQASGLVVLVLASVSKGNA